VIGKLALTFTVVTAVELILLVKIGNIIGLGWTAVLIIATAIAGAILSRQQGAAAWQRIQEDLRSGQMPGDSILDGLCVLVAGATLLTPGVLTDIGGLLLLIPITRKPLKSLIKSKTRDYIDSPNVHMMGGMHTGGGGSQHPFEEAGQPSTAETGPDTHTAGVEDIRIDAERNRSERAGRDDDVIDVTPVDSRSTSDKGDSDSEPLRAELVDDPE
jgi:UPF0716 protein FxsA